MGYTVPMKKETQEELLKQMQREQGSIGGLKTKELYGTTHFVRAAQARWKKEKAKKK